MCKFLTKCLHITLYTVLISIMLILSFLLSGITCHAEVCFVNSDTGYRVEIDDDVDLLTASEESRLLSTMEKITAYGNAALVTTDYAPFSTEQTARYHYETLFGTESGTLFLIDMDNRYIWIYSDGEIYQTINTNYANTITDNSYKLASEGKYYECAEKVFDQILTLLEGGRIAQPMKYICNAILGLIIAVAINFCWMAHCSRIKRPKNQEMLANINHSFHFTNPEFVFTHETRTKNASGSGGSHGGHGGRSGGGGRRSGGGSGHRF